MFKVFLLQANGIDLFLGNSNNPVIAQRMADSNARRGKVVVFLYGKEWYYGKR
jgi:hypothetical protein